MQIRLVSRIDNKVTSPGYYENRFDLVGCEANMPSAVQNGTFTECDGDLQDVIGTFTTNGVGASLSLLSLPLSFAAHSFFAQHHELVTESPCLSYLFPVSTLSPGIQSIPYSIRTPSSSNCVTFSSEYNW